MAAQAFDRRLADVYTLAQANAHVFASPVGPIADGECDAWLPRFVFFGPSTTDVSWRLAFLAGFDSTDLRGSQALLGLVEFFGRQAEHGYGLNLTFFPIIDVMGWKFRARGRRLAVQNWANASAAELKLLQQHVRAAGYHGYLRVETARASDDVIGIRMQAPAGLLSSPDVEVVSARDFEPYAVRFETGGTNVGQHGPLSLADDFGVQPFELTVEIPASWPVHEYERAVVFTLSQFILRYRAFQAYGIHL